MIWSLRNKESFLFQGWTPSCQNAFRWFVEKPVAAFLVLGSADDWCSNWQSKHHWYNIGEVTLTPVATWKNNGDCFLVSKFFDLIRTWRCARNERKLFRKMHENYCWALMARCSSGISSSIKNKMLSKDSHKKHCWQSSALAMKMTMNFSPSKTAPIRFNT